ncbi:MAG: endonuclease/exonuclease/phosphatase family protein, partial [Gammaproteobacteria bacterium]|nr:endonuclease/exonuclease/phosphatase family protein [Gammaproteobacteria bacterium]
MTRPPSRTAERQRNGPRCCALPIAALLGLAVPLQAAEPLVVRIATYNASLTRMHPGELRSALLRGDDAQIHAVAAIIRHMDPDVLLLNEFDGDPSGAAPRVFLQRYLSEPRRDGAPSAYAHYFTAPVNTGEPSGFDLDNDGRVALPEDAFGFGRFPGQYGMLLLSKWPIEHGAVRTFRDFRWADMPGALWPDDPRTAAPQDWYSAAERSALRLSSKSHWDVPIRIGPLRLHLLASHPTPPVFDGVEDRNGRRNHDEIRFWIDYLSGGRSAAYIYDDAGRYGGLPVAAHFILAGDLNADPHDGASYGGAIDRLLRHPRVHADAAVLRPPSSRGAVQAANAQRGANVGQRGDPQFDTADFADDVAGNLRVDYVLPDRRLAVCDRGVFWPATDESAASLLRLADGRPVSDHHLV